MFFDIIGVRVTNRDRQISFKIWLQKRKSAQGGYGC